MTEQSRLIVLSDEQWAVLGPLIDECRPRGKTEPVALRETIEAIVWRHQNGAKWRSVPPDLVAGGADLHPLEPPGCLGTASRTGPGTRRRIGHGLSRRHVDPTKRRGRQKKGGSGAQRDVREALGRSRGGYGTKACVIT